MRKKPSEVLAEKETDLPWIVTGLIPENYVVVLAGEAGAGKSVLMYHLAYAVASGLPFLHFPTRRHRVLYFDDENGGPDFLVYNRWAWAGLGQPDVYELDKWLALETFSLGVDWAAVMKRSIEAFDPGLMIIDTAAAAFRVQDENDNAEAARIIGKVRDLKPPGCAVVILKHMRDRDEHHQRRAIRGAKIWKSQVDFTLFHDIAPRAKRRANNLRYTVLLPDKKRGHLANVPKLRLDPQFTETEPKGLFFKTEIMTDSERDE